MRCKKCDRLLVKYEKIGLACPHCDFDKIYKLVNELI